MKKLFNLRLPVLFACVFSFGTVAGISFLFFKAEFLWFTAVLPLFATGFILSVIFSKSKLLPALIAVSALVLTASAANCFFRTQMFGTAKLDDGGAYYICGTVEQKGATDFGEYIILKNASADGKPVDGKIIAYLSKEYGEFCEEGYKIETEAKISVNRTFVNGKLNRFAENNVKYLCNVNENLKSEYGFSLFGSVRKTIRNTLYSSLDRETAAIAFAMLTGNTQGVDYGALTAFRYGGVAHIFAVSGLHIGLLYGIIAAVLKKLHVNPYVSVAVCLLIITLYAGVCGFSPSSLRAVVMCGVASLSRLFKSKYDALNSLAVAVIILLIINPLNLFGVGFQLSVCAVCGIILLSKRLAKILKRLPKFIVNPATVTLSAQAGILPVAAVKFGYLSIAGLFLNVVAIPVLSVIFVLLFICTVLSALMPFTAPFIMQCAGLPLEAVVSLFINAGFEDAVIYTDSAHVFIIPYYLLLIMLSDKINYRCIKKADF